MRIDVKITDVFGYVKICYRFAIQLNNILTDLAMSKLTEEPAFRLYVIFPISIAEIANALLI